MFAFIRQFAINRGWISTPDVPRQVKAPMDPITSLSNRNAWAVDSIRGSINSLLTINVEIKEEYAIREEAKSKLAQEQSVLQNLRGFNESTISKVAGIFENTSQNGV